MKTVGFYPKDFDSYYWKLNQVLKTLESRSLTIPQMHKILNRFKKSEEIIESKVIE